jgi:hypothetical protein
MENGRFGIGTNVPTKLLDVNGDANVGGGLSAGSATVSGALSAGATTVAALLAPTNGYIYSNAVPGGTAVTGQCNGASDCWGVYGYSDVGEAVRGYSPSGWAGVFYGKAFVSGDATVNGKVTAGPGATTTPLAYGVVNADGTCTVKSANVSCELSGTSFLISIANVNYCYDSFVTTVTPNGYAIPYVTSSGCGGGSGKLYVAFQTVTGTAVTPRFYFVTYKP